MLAKTKWQIQTINILDEVFEERVRQEERYGGVNDLLEDGTGPDVHWLGEFLDVPATQIEAILREDYGKREELDLPTWMHLVREEVAEAFMESDPDRLAEELLQVAALCVSWVERIRKRTESPV